MRPGGGQGKGASFERETCVKLSLWVSKGHSKDLFWRTAMSGGRATVHKAKGSVIRQSGDICAVSPEGHPFTDRYFVECKHLNALQISEFLFKMTGSLARFWAKALIEAREYDKIPMVIAKQNRWPTLILTPVGEQAKPRVKVEGRFGCEVGLFETYLHCEPPPCVVANFGDVVKFQPRPRKRLNE